MSNGAIKSFFNYLRGSEDDVTATTTNERRHGSRSFLWSHSRSESLKTFVKYTLGIGGQLFPSLLSASTFAFLALLADVIVLEVVVYRVGLLSGRYYKCLSDQDLHAFWTLTIMAALYIVVNSVLKSIKDFLASLLSILWRKQLTQHLHQAYFTRMRFYYLQMMHDGTTKTTTRTSTSGINTIETRPLNLDYEESRHLDNPDQRITQDVNSLCVSLSSIIPLLIITPFVIGWYGYQVS